MEKLVSKVDDLAKYKSSYTSSNLDKYISFIINDNINNRIETNSTDNFNFIIKGKTERVVSDIISGKLKIKYQNDLKANCFVYAKDKEDASLNCQINLKNIRNKDSNKVLTFEDDEILSEQHNVLLSGINNIEIIKLKLDEKEETKEIKKKINKTGLAIGLSLGLGVPCFGLVIFFAIYLNKKKKKIINN